MSAYREHRADAPNVLVCSGLDPSGGAGFIADTRVVTALGARPVGVVTSLTVQNTVSVQQVQAVDSEVFGAQLGALLSDVEVHGVKIGLIGSLAIARELAGALDMTAAPVVWDPIAAPSRGRVMFDGPSLDEMLELLARHLKLITPNVRELAVLARRDLFTRDAVIGVARELAQRAGVPVLVKGGHIDDGDQAIDTLIGSTTIEIAGPRIRGGEDVHGTGCALSTAIATYLAQGDELESACRRAKDFVAAQIAAPVRPGRGAAAVV